jgi:hypothetical protein
MRKGRRLGKGPNESSSDRITAEMKVAAVLLNNPQPDSVVEIALPTTKTAG